MKQSITRGLGELTPQAWADLARVANFFRERGPELVKLLALVDNGALPIVREFDAKITGATKVTGKAQWKYSWQEARFNSTTQAWDAVAGGMSGNGVDSPAFNALEGGNTAASAYGYAASDTSLTDHPNYQALPVPNGTPVRMRIVRAANFGAAYFFDAPLLTDGGCAPGAEFLAAGPFDYDEGGAMTVYPPGTTYYEEGDASTIYAPDVLELIEV